ncbi:hypothetical protein TNCV_925661 [Trichonephila clavipes]|nr:hypothetical protein TNCV_925661 [Trichonephila clavipes]
MGRTCAHYSANAGDKLATLTPFKSVMHVQRRVRTEWNVDPPTSKSIHQLDRTLSLSTNDNMLTKYQMIKFIDFCEVWFLPESVARVATIVGDHRCHKPQH